MYTLSHHNYDPGQLCGHFAQENYIVTVPTQTIRYGFLAWFGCHVPFAPYDDNNDNVTGRDDDGGYEEQEECQCRHVYLKINNGTLFIHVNFIQQHCQKEQVISQ